MDHTNEQNVNENKLLNAAPQSAQNKPQEYSLRRTDNKSLRFRGILLAEVQDNDLPANAFYRRHCIYRTKGGKYVVSYSATNDYGNIPDKFEAEVIEDRAAIYGWHHERQKKGSRNAYTVLARAAKKDPTLQPHLEETVE